MVPRWNIRPIDLASIPIVSGELGVLGFTAVIMRYPSSISQTLRGYSSRLGLSRSCKVATPSTVSRFHRDSRSPSSLRRLKLNATSVQKRGCQPAERDGRVMAFDEDSIGFASLDDWGDEGTSGYMVSSGDDSDGDIILNPGTDVDLPAISVSNQDAFTVTTHRLAMLGRRSKKHRIKLGILNNLGLITFLMVLLLFVDWCAWKIVRLPLAPFYFTRPFLISAFLVSVVGYICVPLLYALNIYQVIRKDGPARHSKKGRTPTMGGLFFIPIGLGVARFIAGFSSTEVSGAAAITFVFSAIGLLDDILSLIKSDSNGLSAWIKIILEVAVGSWFSFWLATATIASPYNIKMVVPLPAPLGLVCLGRVYPLLTSLCFVSMANGVNFTDRLDGLVAGTAALAFIGMSIAVLPICPDLGVFGASMAGACVGFLLHNRYKASVFMGDTGSLALGGALAAMAAYTGMFFPLFISSGIFVLEASSVIIQVFYFKATKFMRGSGCRLFRMAPFHQHLELCGFKEPAIVASAYVLSCVLALLAGYVGLLSA